VCLCGITGEYLITMKIVFLDRDGVINEFPGNGKYVTKVKNFHFIPGSLEAIRLLTEQGFTLFVVSNQAGVGKGLFTKDKLKHITKNMLRDINKNGGRIEGVFYCTNRSEQNCDCRKPQIGNIEKALASMGKTLRSAKRAFFVGDTETDILAGNTAGCRTILVRSGREDRVHIKKWDVKPTFITKNLFEATKIIRKSY